MKKIYMILAAMTLLSMSLNAQKLPGKNGIPNFTPTGTAYLYSPNGQFRMPSLGSGEYLFGPYATDDFDATGISYAGYYNAAQDITTVVMLDRSEFEEHLGDSIIGFRFALAGSQSVNVSNFIVYPVDESTVYSSEGYTWSLSQLMSGNVSSQTETTTGYNDITITIPNYYIDFNSILVQSNGTTVAGGSWTYANNGTSLPSGWGGTAQLTAENNGCCVQSGGGTIIIPHSIIDGKENVTVVISARMYSTYSSNTYISIAGATPTQQTYTTTSYASKTWSIPLTTVSVTTSTVDIGRGATKSESLPVSGYNQDYGYHNQMIYRAGQLSMANGAQITSLTFYPEPGTGIPFSGSTVTVRLANTTTDNFGTGTTGNKITSGLTTVATITPVANSGATEWKIDFTTPFTYTGGNLLVQMSCTGNGDWAHANFLGDNQSANVSLVSVGNGYSTTSGSTSTFLPKATFAFTGNVNTPTYLGLQGGEWHDFFLEQPVVFTIPDGDDHIFIGYTFYQQNSASFAPMAVNSNSTGHTHYSLMYASSSSSSSYTRTWWGDGVSGSGNTDRPGDLAVQLIFKSSMEKTPAPTISYTQDAQYGHVTATATDPTATVTLSVGGQTATGVGSVTINIGRGETDVTVNASATAQEPGKLESDPETATYTVQASTLTPTPTPDIDRQVLDLTVQITGTGEGELHMYVDGQEVTNPDYLERTDQDYYVTVTVTAMINDGDHRMSTTTQQVLVPALTGLDLTGWTQLPGTYTNNSVINWNDNLMFVDRFSVSTAYNNHPTEYTYVMTEDTIKLIGQPRTTNDHTIPVEVTRSKVLGYYTEQDVLNDIDRQHVDTCLINADVEMTVKQSGTIYYYTLDRSRNSIMDEDFLELSYLQNDGARYVEFDHYFTWQEPFQYGPVYRFDTINTVLPASAAQGNEGKHYGSYDKHDYFAYVPIVWTHGNDANNTRLNWDNDGLHNSYGSPIWKTSVGKVEIVGKPQLERQEGAFGSTNWTEIEGTDTTKCSVYMVKNIEVNGYLPDRNVTNIKYEPYMFRVWIVSSKANLRKFEWVPGEEGRPGSHYEGRGVIPANTPYMIWEEFIADSTDYITFPTQDVTRFYKWKEVNPVDTNKWIVPEELNMMFAGQDNIAAKDLKILVRFYYRSTGEGLYQNVQQPNNSSNMLMRASRGDGDGKGYYGVEQPGGGDPDPQIPTFIQSIYDYTQTPGEVVDVTYYNMQGMKSSKPFDGINIVVTRYSNGSVSSTKVLR